MDPRVLAVRVVPSMGGDPHRLDASGATIRRVIGLSREYIAIDHGGVPVRLDVIEGSTMPGPVSVRFDLADDDRLPLQIEAMQTLTGRRTPRAMPRVANQVLALRAFDARVSGKGLRSIADHVLGAGDWPGDGEHRKSLVRRLCAVGATMVRDGPRGIMIDRERKLRK